MKRIKPGSRADHARMKSSYGKAAKNVQDALRCKLDAMVRVIIDNPQKIKPRAFVAAKLRLFRYSLGR